MRSRLSRIGGVVLATFLLPFIGLAGIYGLNWLVFHPKLVTGFIHNPLFERPQPADVIVVLAQERERVRHAASLVEQGFAPRTLSTLVDPACIRARKLRALCATGVRNTVDEALAMRRVLIQEGVDRVLIVTSRDHVVRAAAIFAVVFFGSGLEVNIVATPLRPLQKGLSFREVRSFFPSLGGAMLGRVSPELYEWIMPYGRELLHGRSSSNAERVYDRHS
ncbi:MAG: YdcF family protein [Nitrospira sp.]|nr:YdcF family protein [Nitrospira sp.]